MLIVKYLGQIPPKEWYHDPLLEDKNGDTVAILLA